MINDINKYNYILDYLLDNKINSIGILSTQYPYYGGAATMAYDFHQYLLRIFEI